MSDEVGIPPDGRWLCTGGALGGVLMASALSAPAAAIPALAAGTRLGNYRIDAPIGRGGMSTVYRAHRCDGAFEQIVALKVAHCGTASSHHERSIQARLKHPLIAQIHDAGTTDSGEPWLSMELVDGMPIDVWAQQSAAGWADVVACLLQVCEALEHAHRLLVVHCDIKPANVFIEAGRRVKLLDFGVATLLADTGRRARAIGCTPAWASPEQRAGEHVGTASDIYQVGRLLHSLLLTPDRASATRLPALVRSQLEAVALRATAHDDDQRYRTVDALADDLRRSLGWRLVQARRWPATRRLLLLGVRHRRSLGWLLLVAAVLSGLLGWHAAQTDRLHARRAFEAEQAAMGRVFMEGLVRNLGPTIERSDGQGVMLALLRAGSAQTREMGLQPELRVAAVEALADAYVRIGARQPALELIRETAADLARRHRRDWNSRARLAVVEARLVLMLGAHSQTQLAVDRALRLMQQAGADWRSLDHLDLGLVRLHLLEAQHAGLAAERLVQRLLADGARAGLDGTAVYARLLQQRGRIRWTLEDDPASAVPDLRHALMILKRLHGPGYSDVVTMAGILACLLPHDGPAGLQQGRALLTTHLQLARSLFGTHSIEYARIEGMRGWWLLDWGRADERAQARQHLQRSFQVLKARDPHSWVVLNVAQALGRVALDQNDLVIAHAALTWAKQRFARRYGADHLLVDWLRVDLARLACSRDGPEIGTRAFMALGERWKAVPPAGSTLLQWQLHAAECAGTSGGFEPRVDAPRTARLTARLAALPKASALH